MRIALTASLLTAALLACAPPPSVDAGAVADDAGGGGDEDAGFDEDGGAGDVDAGQAGDGGVAADAGARAHGIEVRVENTTCALPGAPPTTTDPLPTMQLERAFTAAVVADTVQLIPLPGRRELVAVRKSGQVEALSLDAPTTAKRTVVDVSTLVNAATGPGLLSAVFAESGAALFVTYVPTASTSSVVIARFTLTAGAATAASAVVLKTFTGVANVNRLGGALLLRDGMLFVVLGDAGSATAPDEMSLPFGKVLRYDARNLTATTLAVPVDGPFYGDANTLGEIYATGFGYPARCAMDRAVGRIWCADIGGATEDEIDAISAGLDYGWPHMEGSTCKDASAACTDNSLTYPVSSAPRASCGVVVGPIIRSGRLAELQGLLPTAGLCGTAVNGGRTDGRFIGISGAMATAADGFAAFGEDEDGDVYVADDTGALFRFARPTSGAAPTFPVTLTKTGCYANVAAGTAAAALIPFEVRSPLWSDGAVKARFIALPGTSKIGFTATGAWTMPIGTILMKEFLLDDDGNAQTSPRKMETRFLIKRNSSDWEGFSYIWDRAGKEGFLLEGSEIVTFPQTGAQTTPHEHTYPSRSECLTCHNVTAGRVLGLQTGRMNVDHDYDGFVENQLAAMDYVGLFDPALTGAPDTLARWADHRDTTAPLQDRARGYLAGNCAHCHLPAGPAPTAIDLRYETSFLNTHTCGQVPIFSVPIVNAKIIDPGSSSTSELFYRISQRGQGTQQMPPLATRILDDAGRTVLQTWIDGLTACP